MILLQGANDALRGELFAYLVEQLPTDFSYHVGHKSDNTSLRHLVELVHRNHVRHLRAPLAHVFEYGHPARYMLSMALAGTGSIEVVCGSADQVRLEARAGFLLSPSPMQQIVVMPTDDLRMKAAEIVRAWADSYAHAQHAETYYCSGTTLPRGTMVVGEGNQRTSDFTRMAFISHTGCSLFLHQALQATGSVHYYLTNANKTESRRQNKLALSQEIELVSPNRILAMGEAAAYLLSELGATFERTYHPQYWKRFRSQHFEELVQTLRGE